MNNFEKIKALDIDEMVEFFTQEYDSDFSDDDCTRYKIQTKINEALGC